jgi:hydroxymethylpyrimidine/phosphomethylpyrimidine kinase
MEPNRPIVLSIAGFDPSGGAGLLADIKTFEQHNVYGLGISTAQTLQTESDFYSLRWESEKDILDAIEKMLSQYDVKVIKIGIVSTIGSLKKIISFIHKQNDTIKIVLDPIIKSSSGFNFWNEKMDQKELFEALSKIYLITPNYNEALQLLPSESARNSAKQLALCCNVLLKGGHNEKEIGVDYLFTKESVKKIEAGILQSFAKHGSGCVLSSAIVANLALGFELDEACRNAKMYIEQFLGSTTTLLGYHHV